MFHVRPLVPTEIHAGDHVLFAGELDLFDSDPAVVAVHPTADGGADVALLVPSPPVYGRGFPAPGRVPESLHLAAGTVVTVMRQIPGL